MYYPFGYEHYLERVRRRKFGTSIAAQISAEDQALVAGLQAVPKAERHRLREISTESAYQDWKYRLLMEQLEPAEETYASLETLCREVLTAWMTSEGCWKEEPENWEQEAEYRKLCERRDAAWERWNELCLEWLDEYLENEREESE